MPVLDLWDLIVAVLGDTYQNRIERGRPVVCRDANARPAISRNVQCFE